MYRALPYVGFVSDLHRAAGALSELAGSGVHGPVGWWAPLAVVQSCFHGVSWRPPPHSTFPHSLPGSFPAAARAQYGAIAVFKPGTPETYVQLLRAIKHCTKLERLESLVQHFERRFDAVHAAAALSRMPKLMHKHPRTARAAKQGRMPLIVKHGVTQTRALLERLPRWDRGVYCRQVANAVWAAGSVSRLPGVRLDTDVQPLLELLAKGGYTRLFQGGEPAHVAQLYFGLARLRFKEKRLIAALHKYITRHIDGFKMHEVAMVAWAMAKLKTSDVKLQAALAEQAVAERLWIKPCDVGMFLWAYARTDVLTPRTVAALADAIDLCVHRMHHGDIANSVWAITKALSAANAAPAPQDLPSGADAADTDADSESAQESSPPRAAAGSRADTPVAASAEDVASCRQLLGRLLVEAEKKVDSFTAGSLVTVLSCHASAGFMHAAASAVAAQRDLQVTPTQAVAVLHAFVRAQYRGTELRPMVRALTESSTCRWSRYGASQAVHVVRLLRECGAVHEDLFNKCAAAALDRLRFAKPEWVPRLTAEAAALLHQLRLADHVPPGFANTLAPHLARNARALLPCKSVDLLWQLTLLREGSQALAESVLSGIDYTQLEGLSSRLLAQLAWACAESGVVSEQLSERVRAVVGSGEGELTQMSASLFARVLAGSEEAGDQQLLQRVYARVLQHSEELELDSLRQAVAAVEMREPSDKRVLQALHARAIVLCGQTSGLRARLQVLLDA